MRLIDADSFKLDLRTAKATAYLNSIDDCDTEDEAQKIDDEMYYSTRSFIDVMNHRPTVDAVPVVHGYWMKYEVDVAEHPWHCSHCGYCPPKFVSHIDEMEYCNHCGAKMDDEGR